MNDTMWERWPKEPDKAFSYFIAYKNMGLDRSLSKVATKFKRSQKNMQGLSSKWEWVKRASAWDNHVEEKIQTSELDQIVEMRKRHVEASMELQILSLNEIRKLYKKSLATDEPIMNPTDLRQMLVDAQKIERLNRGEPDSIVRNETVHDFSKLSDEELKLFNQLVKKLENKE